MKQEFFLVIARSCSRENHSTVHAEGLRIAGYIQTYPLKLSRRYLSD